MSNKHDYERGMFSTIRNEFRAVKSVQIRGRDEVLSDLETARRMLDYPRRAAVFRGSMTNVLFFSIPALVFSVIMALASLADGGEVAFTRFCAVLLVVGATAAYAAAHRLKTGTVPAYYSPGYAAILTRTEYLGEMAKVQDGQASGAAVRYSIFSFCVAIAALITMQVRPDVALVLDVLSFAFGVGAVGGISRVKLIRRLLFAPAALDLQVHRAWNLGQQSISSSVALAMRAEYDARHVSSAAVDSD